MSTTAAIDEKTQNGLIINGTYLPEELLAQIFCYIDYTSLLNCQLVCKHWKTLIQTYVWRKKAEISLAQPHLDNYVNYNLHFNIEKSWYIYYLICKKKPFGRNLIKNHSGEYGIETHWDIIRQGGDCWAVENPPLGVPPLPTNEPVFEGKQYCFVTSYEDCCKRQLINLKDEGLPPCILDNLQPPIVVSEWYSCRWDCPAVYDCTISLIGKDDTIVDFFRFTDSMVGDKQNKWFYVSHEFKNYGPGVKEIHFCHGGIDQSFWAGHYGSKMAGACVYVKVPVTKSGNSKEAK